MHTPVCMQLWKQHLRNPTSGMGEYVNSRSVGSTVADNQVTMTKVIGLLDYLTHSRYNMASSACLAALCSLYGSKPRRR